MGDGRGGEGEQSSEFVCVCVCVIDRQTERVGLVDLATVNARGLKLFFLFFNGMNIVAVSHHNTASQAAKVFTCLLITPASQASTVFTCLLIALCFCCFSFFGFVVVVFCFYLAV